MRFGGLCGLCHFPRDWATGRQPLPFGGLYGQKLSSLVRVEAI
jgi:hypothetical protein